MAMFLFCALTAVVAAGVVSETEAAEYNGYQECISYPEGHCVLEGRAKQMCAHAIMYTFDWETKTCGEIYWSLRCGWPDAKGPNMFPTEKKCLYSCSGWSD